MFNSEGIEAEVPRHYKNASELLNWIHAVHLYHNASESEKTSTFTTLQA